MQLLLDTNVLLWAMSNDKRLARDTAKLILDPQNRVIVSAVSFWEVSVKKSLGKISISLEDLKNNVEECQFDLLPITAEHCIKLSDLPQLHRDPFDRMLVTQSKLEPAILLTGDSFLASYGDFVVVV
jgi:PIN domain nuclease of toxin-antitoxin system